MFERLLTSFQNIFKIPELRTRILFTLGMLVIYRIGYHVPVPGVEIKLAPVGGAPARLLLPQVAHRVEQRGERDEPDRDEPPIHGFFLHALGSRRRHRCVELRQRALALTCVGSNAMELGIRSLSANG